MVEVKNTKNIKNLEGNTMKEELWNMFDIMESFGDTLEEYFNHCLLGFDYDEDYDFESTEEYAWLAPVYDSNERALLLKKYDERNGFC